MIACNGCENDSIKHFEGYYRCDNVDCDYDLCASCYGIGVYTKTRKHGITCPKNHQVFLFDGKTKDRLYKDGKVTKKSKVNIECDVC